MRKINFSALKFQQEPLTYEQALSGVKEFQPSAKDFSSENILNVKSFIPLSEKACAKLEI